MPSEQNAGQDHNINVGDKSLKDMENFKLWLTKLTTQNCVHE